MTLIAYWIIHITNQWFSLLDGLYWGCNCSAIRRPKTVLCGAALDGRIRRRFSCAPKRVLDKSENKRKQMMLTKRRLSRIRLFFVCAPLTLLLAGSAHGLELVASVFSDAEFTDNAGRSNTNKLNDVIISPGVRLNGAHDSAALVFGASYDIERRYQVRSINSNRNAAIGNASLLWHAVPQRLDFSASQTTRETTQRLSSAGTEDDKKIITNTSIGPTLRFQPRGSDELRLSYQFSASTDNQDPTDRETNRYSASYQYRWNDFLSWTLEASRDDIAYDSSAVPDVELDNYTLTLRDTAGLLRLDLTGGRSIYRRVGQEDVEGAIWDAQIVRDLGQLTTIELSASRRITDSTSELLGASAQEFDSVFDTFDNSDLTEVFTATSYSAALSRQVGSTGMTLLLEVSEDDYEDFPRDNEQRSVEFIAERQLTPRTNLTLGLRGSNIREIQQGFEYDQYELYAQGAWQAARNLEVTGGIDVTNRRVKEGAVSKFSEIRLLLGVEYTLFQTNR